MSHKEYIAKCDGDQLVRLIELAQDKLITIRNRPKKEYFVVSDGWANYGFFELTDYEAALEFFSKNFEHEIDMDCFETLSISVVKYAPEDIEDLLMKGDK